MDFILVSTPTNATTLHTLVPLFLSLLHSNEILYFWLNFKNYLNYLELPSEPEEMKTRYILHCVLLIILHILELLHSFLVQFKGDEKSF